MHIVLKIFIIWSGLVLVISVTPGRCMGTCISLLHLKVDLVDFRPPTTGLHLAFDRILLYIARGSPKAWIVRGPRLSKAKLPWSDARLSLPSGQSDDLQ